MNKESTLKILEEFSNKIIKTVSTGSGDPNLIQKTADLLCEKTEEMDEYHQQYPDEDDMIATAISRAPSDSIVHKTFRLGFKSCYKWIRYEN